MQVSNYSRLFKLYPGERRWLILSLGLNVVVASATLAIPALSAELINNGIIAKNFEYCTNIGFFMLIAALIAGICQVANSAIAVWAAEITSHYLRTQLFAKIQSLSSGNIDRFRSSDLQVRLTTDAQNVKTAMLQSVNYLLQAPLLRSGSIIITHFMAPSLTWIMIVILLFFFILLIIYFRIVEPAFSRKQQQIDRVNKALKETLTGIRVVKAFVRQKFEIAKFENATEDLRIAACVPQNVMAYLIPTMFAITILGFAAIYYTGGVQVLEGTGLSIGDVTSVAQYILILMMPLLIIAIVLPFITQANSSLTRIFEILDSVPEISNPVNPAQLDPSRLKGRVVFENVSLNYRNARGDLEGEVLKNINLVAEPGETIGLLGATGSGKTSLISLIPRFYDVTKGKVLVDSNDVRDLKIFDLRRYMGIVPQETVLFSGSIKDNIAYAKVDATDAEIEHAAKMANAHDFIMSLPEKYDTLVGEKGARLSGGEKQRVAIARALLRDPKILIFDEATSSLDAESEGLVQDAIDRLMHNRTTFVIAHRLSTVQHAHKIIVLDKGNIIETGNHSELLAQNGLYKKLYEMQFKEDAA